MSTLLVTPCHIREETSKILLNYLHDHITKVRISLVGGERFGILIYFLCVQKHIFVRISVSGVAKTFLGVLGNYKNQVIIIESSVRENVNTSAACNFNGENE